MRLKYADVIFRNFNGFLVDEIFEHMLGIEPAIFGLLVQCSTN